MDRIRSAAADGGFPFHARQGCCDVSAPSTVPAFSVEAVACEAVRAVRDAMGDAREWGLADYPRHLNVGDSAIWLGERQLLRPAGVRVVASCDTATYSRRAFGRALAGRPVLLH